MAPGWIVIPDQIVDYTYGREHTFFDSELTQVTHIDFTYPYCEGLRRRLISAGNEVTEQIVESATYGATQGPRLETAAGLGLTEAVLIVPVRTRSLEADLKLWAEAAGLAA